MKSLTILLIAGLLMSIQTVKSYKIESSTTILEDSKKLKDQNVKDDINLADDQSGRKEHQKAKVAKGLHDIYEKKRAKFPDKMECKCTFKLNKDGD